jgi:DNA-binding response OmpR family regulator
MNNSPGKILIVHGDKEERGKLAITLNRFGHSLSFSDGIKKPELDIGEYDLIIIDEYLDRNEGLVFIQHLSKGNRAKTIFLSSGSIKERKELQDSMGIYECIKKPFIPLKLVVVVCDFFISCWSNEEYMHPLGT